MEVLRVGIIGCGHIAAAHVRGWAKSETSRVTGVFDSHRDKAENLSGRLRIGSVFESIESLLADCDVVDICTPPDTHGQLLEEAARAGRHVLIEKPVVTDLESWPRLAALFGSDNRRLAAVHNLKFTESVQRAKRWISERRIGRVIRLDWCFLTSPAFDRMLTADGHWSHRLPGGRWFETLPHNLYLIHYLAGPMELASVVALSSPSAPPGVRADDVTVTLRREGCLATIHFSAHCSLNQRSATITGSNGIIRLDLLSNLATLTRVGDSRPRRLLGRPLLEAGSSLARSLPQRPATLLRRLRGWTPHANLISAFADHLHNRGPSPTPIEEIDYVVRYTDSVGRQIERQIR